MSPDKQFGVLSGRYVQGEDECREARANGQPPAIGVLWKIQLNQRAGFDIQKCGASTPHVAQIHPADASGASIEFLE